MFRYKYMRGPLWLRAWQFVICFITLDVFMQGVHSNSLIYEAHLSPLSDLIFFSALSWSPELLRLLAIVANIDMIDCCPLALAARPGVRPAGDGFMVIKM